MRIGETRRPGPNMNWRSLGWLVLPEVNSKKRGREDRRVLVDCLAVVVVAHEGVQETQLHPSFRWH
jgi:hypothetical protein